MPVTAPHHAALLLIALLTSGFVGCAKTLSPEQYMQEAKAFQVKHNYKSAIIQLKNVLAQQPDNGEARFLLGKIYNETGESSFAEIELRRAQKQQYEPVQVLAALGAALAGKGEYKKALDELTAFQKEHGELPPELLSLQGNIRLALGSPDAASSFEAALKQSPGYADAHLGLARVAVVAGKVDKALHDIDLAIEQSPNSVEAWLFNGDVLRNKSASDASGEAEKAYRRAAEINPNDAPPRLRLADFYSVTGKFDAAQSEINAVRTTDQKNLEALYQQAVLALRERKYADADEVIQQVLKVAPEHMKSVLVAGTTAYYLGKTELADKHLTSYLKRFPGDVYARKLLAANLLHANQPAQALDVVSPLLSRAGDAQTLAIAGNAARRSNELAKANEYLTKAVALAPENAALRTELGITHLAAEDTQQGISDLESAARLAGSAPKADVILISTYLRRRDYDKALAAITLLEKKLPNNPATFNLRGIALLGKERAEEARTSFEKALALQPGYFSAANNLAAVELRNKNFDAARGYLQTFLKKNPANVEAMLALAEIAVLAGDDKEKLSWLEKAAKAVPTAIQPRVLLALYHADRKDLQKALTIAHEVQSAHPDNAVALNLLASLQFATGDKEGAATTYGIVVKQTPKSALARYRLALVQIDSQNWAGARASLTKALELEPKYVEAQVALTALEIRTGHSADALKFAQQVRGNDPKSPIGPSLEGDVRMAQKNYNSAFRAYDAALGIAKSSVLFIKVHDALVRAGNAKEADARAAQWMKSQPADSAVHVYLADVDIRSGQTKSAIEHYQAVLQKEPNNILALNNLAGLYQKQNDPRALATAEQAYKLRSGDPTILDTLGWILLQQGDFKRGIPLLQEAVTKSPQFPPLRYHLALGYVKSGDKAKARETLDALLASDDPFPERADVVTLRGQL
jgi:putative PEP-CTERM system TPR-repeat lipoprotein